MPSDATGAIHKGAAGPSLVYADLEMCITQDAAGFGERMPAFEQTGPWQTNTENVGKYKDYAQTLQTVVVKPGSIAKAIAKSAAPIFWFQGLTYFQSWPPQGGYATLQVINTNDGSQHRLCSPRGAFLD